MGVKEGCRTARQAETLFVGCRDGVAALELPTGKLRWWFDSGSGSWPTVTPSDDVVLLGTRDAHDQPLQALVKKPNKPQWYVVLVKDASYLGGYRPEFARLNDPPNKDVTLWSVAAPMSPQSRYVVTLYEGQGAQQLVMMVDVTAALEKHGRAVVRTSQQTRRMTLMEGDRQVSSAVR